MSSTGVRSADSYWTEVARKTLAARRTGADPLVIPKSLANGMRTPHPSEATGVLVHHIGELKGQVADWRASFSEHDEGFHCVEYHDRYECHVDSKDPFKDPVGHLASDSPGTLVAIGAVAAVGAAAAIAYALTRDKE